jgi:hypothetical protein
MNAKHTRIIESFRRVQNWITAHPDLTAVPRTTTTGAVGSITPAGTSAIAAKQTALANVIQSFAAAGASQEQQRRTGRGATLEAQVLRSTLLLEHMKPLAQLAAAVTPATVRMVAELRMPNHRLTPERLANAGDAMANAAEQYKTVLVNHGFAPDFVEQLRSVTAKYKAIRDTRGQSIAARRGALKSLDASAKEGRALVSALDVLITQKVRQNPMLVAEWSQLKRVTLTATRPSSLTVDEPSATQDSATTTAVPSTPTSQQKAA